MLSVALTPDGAWVLSGSKDRGVQFWDPSNGVAQLMLQGHKNSGKNYTIEVEEKLDTNMIHSHLRRSKPYRWSLRYRFRRLARPHLEILGV